jgi:phosphoglycolate phosphatase-like HAD superfamily hydrolase
MPRFSAVLFDLDGTLLDTESLSSSAIDIELEKHGAEPVDWILKKRILGLPGPAWSKIVIEERNLSGVLDPIDLVNNWERNMTMLYPDVTEMPGALELVCKLREKGVKMAVVTSSTKESVALKCAYHNNIFDKMDLFVCGDDEEVDFYIVLIVLQLLNASSLSCRTLGCIGQTSPGYVFNCRFSSAVAYYFLVFKNILLLHVLLLQ